MELNLENYHIFQYYLRRNRARNCENCYYVFTRFSTQLIGFYGISLSVRSLKTFISRTEMIL